MEKSIKISKRNNIKCNENFEYNTTQGFENIGNSCYMNSFLQILLHCPHFLCKLKKLCRNKYKDNCLIKSIIDLSDNPEDTKYLYLIKNYMKNASLEYNLLKQNDSQDFGKDLINEIIKDYNNIYNNQYEYSESESDMENNYYNKTKKYYDFIRKYQKNEIFIEKMFTINEIEEFNNKYNKTDYKFNTSFDVELNFPKNISKNNTYNLTELLDLKYTNNNFPKNKIKFITINKRKICKLPDILMITIVRTILGKTFIRSPLLIPEEIDLGKYVDEELIGKNVQKKYVLFAKNYKLGIYSEMGHYYCDIKINNIWYKFDDKNVNRINCILKTSSRSVVGLFYIKESIKI